jgi:hypothetical protein
MEINQERTSSNAFLSGIFVNKLELSIYSQGREQGKNVEQASAAINISHSFW